MANSAGFSDVDGSGRANDLVDYLALLARCLAQVRTAPSLLFIP